MLSRNPLLAKVGAIAAMCHERLDGSGYPRGLSGAAIPFPARLLAAAQTYRALGEDRPHRAAIPPSERITLLHNEVSAGRLDADAVRAVLIAAGHHTPRPNVQFRGLIPPGPFDTTGTEAATSRFEHWFGGEDTFELLDATAGRLGAKLYLRWKIRMYPTDAPNSARIAEQHVFATASDRIESLDLLYSGWNAEH